MAKFVQIYTEIKKDIEEEHYPCNSFLPSERKLSETYNVQRMTIRKALDMLSGEGYIEKKPGAGNKIIYKRSGGTSPETLLYIIPEREFSQQYQPYHWEICLSLEKLCKTEGLNLHLMKLSEDDTIDNFLRRIQNIKGIVWVTQIDHPFLDLAVRKTSLPLPSSITPPPSPKSISASLKACSPQRST